MAFSGRCIIGFLDPGSWASALGAGEPDPNMGWAQVQMGVASLDQQIKQFDAAQKMMAPFVKSGTQNINRLNALMQPGGELDPSKRFTMADFQTDPGYKWRTQQGINALTAAGSAAGNLGSGALGTSLVNYGQNAASNEYQNAFNRWQAERGNEFNMLAGMANPAAAQQVGNWGMQAGANIGNAFGNISNAFGNIQQNQLMSGLMRQQGASQLGGSLGQGIGNWLMADSGYEWDDGSGSLNNAENLWDTISGWFSS